MAQRSLHDIEAIRDRCVGKILSESFSVSFQNIGGLAVIFLIANGVGAAWSVTAGPWSYGAGFAMAALASLLIAIRDLRWTFRNLEFVTFTHT